MKPMITIGLLGGIASGKSTVARFLAELGAVVLDADRLAHEVLSTTEIRQALVARWGKGVLTADKQVDRATLSKLVFGESEAAVDNRRFLEQIVHPGVRQKIRAQLATLREQNVTAVVLDVPLLLEAGYAPACDHLLFIDTPDAQRMAHAAKRGWSAEELSRREAAQRSLAEKKMAATEVITNDGSFDRLRESLARFWRLRVRQAAEE